VWHGLLALPRHGRAGRIDPTMEPGPTIAQRLRGKHVLITGATGFLGQALLVKVLEELPETTPILLIRPQWGTDGRARLSELLSRPAFASLRERHGLEGLADRVEVLEGDVTGQVPALPGDLDVVFHCAAAVAFDPAIDEGFRTNVLGPSNLYEAVMASGSRPHLVHVSTAYVAGVTRGVVPEARLDHTVDWREEADAALRVRASVEESSRRPEILERAMAGARREHGRAGPHTVAEDAERRRRNWVSKRLVRHGRARAQVLGWPDVYTLTKALGERVAEEQAPNLPVSIVRPSIVESALSRPYPGWIEGFKMAEPIVLAYGRGAIPEFPGIPEGISDLIPVDLVANALVAVAANPPEDGPAHYHVCSGSRNPLHYRRLFELVRTYFRQDPLPQRGRGAIRVPDWRFPGKTRVERMLRAGELALDAADRVVRLMPRSSRTRDLVRRVDRERGRLEFVRRYSDLYGAYTEAEVIYTDERALALHRSLAGEDAERFGFDAAVIDWDEYLKGMHFPAVTSGMRELAPYRPSPRVHISDGHRGVLAVFDLEGTVLASNVVESYLWLRLSELPAGEWPEELAAVAVSLPRYLRAERRDRGDFLRSFYRRYAGASVERVRSLVGDRLAELTLRRASPAAVRRIREHRAAGHRTVLITGAVDALVEPLAPLFDEIVATRLSVRNGRYTGFLERPPLVGEARASWLRRYADEGGADLAASYAYADSHSDLPLLRAVGNPVAVNPDVALFRHARRKRWPVEEWHHSRGTPKVLVPGRAS
jgi:alcohol-forming fatty acyl-CoA reductase